MPTNRITNYLREPAEPPELAELRTAFQETLQNERAWHRTQLQWKYDDGYACGFVHAVLVVGGVLLAGAIWRSL